MVKFSREYEASIIPEWKGAFVDYKCLKKLIKKIKIARRRGDVYDDESPSEALVAGARGGHGSGSYGFSIHALAARFAPRVRDSSEREFLERAHEELEKVNRFYVEQEVELLSRGEALIDQLRILADVKRSGLASPQSTSDGTLELQQAQMMDGAAMADDMMAELERNGVNFVGLPGKNDGSDGRGIPPTVRIDIPATNPGWTALKMWEDLVNVLRKDGADPAAAAFVHRKKIQHAEKNIRDAFMALYRGLELLKKFSSLNVKAFTKILKKFVKVSEQQEATDLFSQKMKRSSFSTSDKVIQLADEVESLFMKHFAANDKMVAMKYLKPQQRKSRHMVTFLVGA